MASFRLSLLPLSGGRLSTFHSKHLPVRCATERQALFSRIVPVYDNSGSGDLAFLLSAKVGSNGKVTGLDFSKEQLLIASSRQHLRANACYRNIVWVGGDATDLPFYECHFDAITIGFGLRNVVDKRKAMQEVFRVLKPGSRVSILDFNKNSNQLTAFFQEWMIDNVVVPVARSYGLAKEGRDTTAVYSIGLSDLQWTGKKGDRHPLMLLSREDLSLAGKFPQSDRALVLSTGKELEQLALDTGFSYAKHYEVGGGLMGNFGSYTLNRIYAKWRPVV